MAKIRNLRREAAKRIGPGSPSARFNYLMKELDKRWPDPQSFLSSPYEARLLGMIDADRKELENRRIETEVLRDALEHAIIALDDWIADYADVMCDEDVVKEARKRIHEHGTLYYIAENVQRCRKALE